MAEHHLRSAYGIRLAIVVLVSLILVGCGPNTSVPTYSISGRVTRKSDSNGLDDITLQFSGGFGTATTAGGGYWSKTGLKGTVTVTPTGQGWTFTPANRTISSAAGDVNFEASPVGTYEYSVSGYVQDNLGNAVRDVVVEFDKGFGSTSTGTDGKWSKSGLSGTVIATPKKDGWAFYPGSMPLTGATTSANFNCSYTVSGRVTDGAGRGVRYATLTFSNSSYSTMADSSGYWVRSGISGSVVVSASKDGWAFLPISRTVHGPAPDVDFAGTYRVDGLVSDADGSPVGSVRLDFSGGHSSTYTGSDGRWTKEGLSGDVTVTPNLANWTFSPSSRNVSEPYDQVNFTATAAGSEYSVSGYVRDNLGNAVRDVVVEFDKGFGSTSTGTDGKWSKSGLSGTVIATPKKDGWAFYPGSMPLTGATTSANFNCSYTVSGRVTDGAGRGVRYATLTFSNSSYSTMADSSGYWVRSGISGSVVVSASKDGWAFLPISRTVHGPAPDVDFAGTYRVDGLVSDADGSPVGSVRLDFSGGHSSTYTGSDGRWTKEGLSGDVTVTPNLANWTFSPSSRNVSEPYGQVNFTRTYSVSGRVVNQQGNGVPYITIRFDGGYYSTYTDTNGDWTKEGLSGSVTITPEAVGYTFIPGSLSVSGPRASANFTAIAVGSKYSVSGRVTGSGDAGIADVLLFLGSGFGTARTASDGSWSVTGLSGDVTVTPAKAGLVFTPETVTVSGWSSNIDFTGSPATDTYSVSGRVTDGTDGSGLYGVSFTFSGGFGRAQGDVLGYWSKSGLYGTVTVTPSRSGWIFEPESRTVTGADNAVDVVGSRSGGSASGGGDN